MKVELICKRCGKVIMVKPSALLKGRKYCSLKCSTNDRPHRPFISNGYVYVWNGYGFVLEHRVIMETHIGRNITTEEHVHHINRIKTDNRIENLLLIASCQEHQILHGTENYNIFHKTVPCNTCGKLLQRSASDLKKGHGHAFCSKDCFIKSDAFKTGMRKRKEKRIEAIPTTVSATCKPCGKNKPIDAFRLRYDGSIFTYTCKECIRVQRHEYHKLWYSDPINQERAKTRANARYRKIKSGEFTRAA